jgi:folate-dependent phosphoribosylglycinamide formyltransferase PurN
MGMPKIAIITAEGNYNLDALLEARADKNLKDGDLAVVVSRAEDTRKMASDAGIEAMPLDANGAYGPELADKLAAHKPDLIVSLDTPHNFSSAFLEKFPHKVIAIYPVLAGQSTSTNAVEDAYAAFQNHEIKWTGCNVHYVGADGATAEVMRQLVVPVEPKDTLDRFVSRMRKAEKWLLLKAVKQYLYELRNTDKRSKS